MELGGKSEKIRLPSFISHPNGIVFCVFKRQRSMIEMTKIFGPKFICHPNEMVLKVLNQKLCPWTSSSSSSMETEIEIAKATRFGTIIRVLKQKISTSSSSAVATTTSLVKMETKTETKTNWNAEQRVKQLKRFDWQHYSHAHHRPPQQQYKSNSWTIAIILKLTFVAWNSWTYRIGY